MSHWQDEKCNAYLRQLPLAHAVQDAQSSAHALGLAVLFAVAFLLGFGAHVLLLALLR